MEEVADISKEELRLDAKAKRKKIKNKKEKDDLIYHQVINHEKVLASSHILVYLATNEEVATLKIIETLLKKAKKIYAPKVIGDQLEFYLVDDIKKLQVGKFKILEPTSQEKLEDFTNSCILVPGLLFDDSLNRLGYGGGYYDRFLDKVSLYKIGLCYQEFKIKTLPTFPHDIKMDEIITERT